MLKHGRKLAHREIIWKSAQLQRKRIQSLQPRIPASRRSSGTGTAKVQERPSVQISDQQWAMIAGECANRGDPAHPCPICQEHFGLQEQVRTVAERL